MSILNRMLAPKEVKAILGVLDEADQRLDYPIFSSIKKMIEGHVLSQSEAVAEKVRSGISARQSAYSMIANLAGDMAESGEFHVYRGVLNPVGGGEDLLRIFDAAVDEMLLIGAIDNTEAAEQKSNLRACIREIG